MTTGPKRRGPLALWLGAFLTTGILLYVYGHIPLGPILIGGAFALAVTLFRRSRG